ncbi:hypothetical protein EV667_3014 [Ancylobacter aquaticus]|uniref:Uncharacterized protein n=2 Tax=Ancylobacter aquaticus TaxID=100 RepID=A0A4V2PJL3_ANCAQ|nr:hypothetical protein EV667_3014 [Ancylobacter aquaticus]
MVRTVHATGWLRASGLGSSTATFEISFEDGRASGRVLSEMIMIIEARAAGRAILVTEAGRWINIKPTDLTAAGLGFIVLQDADEVSRFFI